MAMSSNLYPINAHIRALYGSGVNIDLTVLGLPDEIDDSYSANFTQTDMLGRSSPPINYGNGGPREINFSIFVREDLVPDGEDITEVVNKFRSLSYPEYVKGVVIPPELIVRMGDMFSIRAVCNNVAVSWEKPYGTTSEGNTAYYQAEISLSFQESVGQDVSYSASEVMSGRDTTLRMNLE